ncbi:MAG: glycosyltransferase family 39 protein [Thermoflexales bacterium]|nr:glycosyltransferase family 39 protein [Thermoflexales bacterium]
MWLDEIFGYRLARLGVPAIGQNSFTDPHPPGFYLAEWLLTAFASSRSEWMWRWISVLASTIAVAVVWKIARRHTGDRVAVSVGAVLMTLPAVGYYSQEARATMTLVALSALSSWVTDRLLSQHDRRLQVFWTLLSVVGLWFGYSYVMVVAVQAAFLAGRHLRRIGWIVSFLTVGASGLLLVPWATSALRRVSLANASQQPLSPLRIAEVLSSNDPARFGESVQTVIAGVIVSFLLIVAFGSVLVRPTVQRRYFAVQFVLPLTAYFVFSAVSGISVPQSEGKQFIVLLPSVLVLVGFAISALRLRLPLLSSTTVGLSVILLVLNLVGLRTYWGTIKSPEGALISMLGSTDTGRRPVISLHTSLSFATGMYLPTTNLFVNPQSIGHELTFRYVTGDEFLVPTGPRSVVSLDRVREERRLWLVAPSGVKSEAIEAIEGVCALTSGPVAGPFAAFDVQCSAPAP